MRRLGAVLLAASIVLIAARLCTGIVYRADEAVATLVLRPPGLAIERTQTDPYDMRHEIVIDEDEITLVYFDEYFALMRAVPMLAPGLAIAGLALAWRGRRRAARRPVPRRR